MKKRLGLAHFLQIRKVVSVKIIFSSFLNGLACSFLLSLGRLGVRNSVTRSGDF